MRVLFFFFLEQGQLMSDYATEEISSFYGSQDPYPSLLNYWLLYE